MVCEKCEKKLSKAIVPDKLKDGASNTTEGGGRKINENKLLSKKNRWSPLVMTKCITCKQRVHQNGKYCHTCAYSKGVCAMCGKQMLDTKLYKQSNVLQAPITLLVDGSSEKSQQAFLAIDLVLSLTNQSEQLLAIFIFKYIFSNIKLHMHLLTTEFKF